MIAPGRPPGAKEKQQNRRFGLFFWYFYLRDRLTANLVILEQPLVFASLAPIYKHTLNNRYTVYIKVKNN